MFIILSMILISEPIKRLKNFKKAKKLKNKEIKFKDFYKSYILNKVKKFL